MAQDYSQLCEWRHNPNIDADFKAYSNETQWLQRFDPRWVAVTDNLYVAPWQLTQDNIVYGVQLYYGEYINYKFRNTTDGCCPWPRICGHYTQLVWANTRYVGCGYTYCNGLTDGYGGILV